MLNKKKLIKLVQVFIAVGTIYFLCTKVNSQRIFEVIHSASVNYLLLGLLLLTIQMTLAAYRWLLVMRMNGFSLPAWQCVGSFAASSFINTTLPVSIGGDLMRVWVTTRHGVPTKVSLYNVLLDRILNTVGLALLVVMTQIPLLINQKHEINIIASLLSLALLGALIGLILIKPILKHFKRSPAILAPLKILSQMTQQVMLQPIKNLTQLATALYIGYFLLIIAIILIAQGLHTEISFHQALISIPLVILFSAIPITPGNWGIREGVMVLALKPFGISAEVALSISILFGMGTILSSVPATIVWFLQKNWPQKSLASST